MADEAAAVPGNASASVGGDVVVHAGGCHCGAVRFEVEAPAALVLWDCSCSICRMRRNLHFVVPAAALHPAPGTAAALAEYRFGTRAAVHRFCRTCGVTPFYTPRSNPDGVAVTYGCIDPGTATVACIKHFDGQKWEAAYAASGIATCSKV
eukprot:SM000176S03126  [mRNA]  locus=s176:128883:129905:+ [translate_table: standard]